MTDRRTSRLNRRSFLAASMASLAGPALAHKGEPYVLPEEFQPTLVRLRTKLPAGEIHVDPNIFRLFWTLEGGKAIRYAVGIGRAGLYHAGEFTVGRKAEWPRWTPTPAMIRRDPAAYAQFADGVPGGINNPLGARALYLYDEQGRDTYLRIHGTNAPQTIGRAVSNGCARLVNEHVIDLYDRVPVGTRVVLHPKGTPVDS